MRDGADATLMTMYRDHGRHERHIGAGVFKARRLQLTDQVAKTRKPIIITKRGKAVAKLVPVEAA
jgi:antitoxin (DNA-binding transcriptional repressor) of toxin-antitoxin stability system